MRASQTPPAFGLPERLLPDAPSISAVESVEVVLAHQFDQSGGIVRGGGVAGLVDLAGKRIGIVLELKRSRVAPIAQEKPSVLGDALVKAVIFGKIGVDGDPFAVEVLLGRSADRARRAAPFDAEQVLGIADRVFPPAG